MNEQIVDYIDSDSSIANECFEPDPSELINEWTNSRYSVRMLML